ncbi:MAG TPA: hypothetical protein VLV78_01195 [Thermoanaerobaculia bacterium]|nr:hypothetical protein [Thermoanaerobaculia bacterium]
MIKRSILAVLILACACTVSPEKPAVFKGHLVLDTAPNPLIARRVGDDLYELSFDIIMREAGGVDVRIEDFTVSAIAFKGVPIRSQTFPAQYIIDHGYPAEIGAGRYLRFSFVKRWTIPARLLLSGASLRVSARTVDADGRHDTSETRIGVVVTE